MAGELVNPDSAAADASGLRLDGEAMTGVEIQVFDVEAMHTDFKVCRCNV